MGNIKSLALLILLLSLSLAVFADTSNDATKAKEEVKPSEVTDATEPQQIHPQQFSYCRFGCCGSMIWLQCNLCCPNLKAAEAFKAKALEANTVEPQQRWRGRPCRYGCCGSSAYGQCSACCPRKLGVEEGKKKEETKP